MERETAMKILKELHGKSLFAERTALETIIPELKESKDETIRKEIIEFVDINTLSVDERHDRWIAWLEKQCYTKKDVDDAYIKGISDAKNELDKQGEQKTAVTDFNAKDWYVSKVDGKIHDMTYNPTDKVEPRFKVKYAGSEYNVLEVKDIAGVTFYGIEDEPNHIDYVKADNCEIISGYGIKENGSPYPTKPSMFSEQKPADKNATTKQDGWLEIPFGAKDSELQESTYYIPDGFHAEIDDDKVAIKKGEKSAAWSDEDEGIVLSIEQVIQCASSLNLVPEKLDKIDNWLKSLKDRIGG